MAAEIRVSAPSLTRTGDGRWRVAAEVDGQEIHVVADVPLAANGDAWATMMMLPATKSGATLRIASDLDARLGDSLEGISALARFHWRHRGARVVADRIVGREPSGDDALFFTCGIDSFYALSKCRDVAKRLFFVRGLNINLVGDSDEAHWQRVRAGVAAVAREIGIPAHFPETNLRQHPTFLRVGWHIVHIAAIAGVAHALSPVVSRIHVATSEQRLPWGSDPILDPLWGSDAVQLVGEGWEATRLAKVRAIADWPLVHRHLSVCYVSRGDTLNCGVCQKCVSSQLRFEIVGARDRLEGFPKVSMRELVDGVPWLGRDSKPRWIGLLPHVADRELRAAIVRLLERRKPATEWLRGQGLWLRKTSAGRRLRRMAKRLLIEKRPLAQTG